MNIFEKFRELRDNQAWTFAKTYAKKAPHHYIVKQELPRELRNTFVEILIFIRENGYKKMFWAREFMYYDFEGYTYWSYGDPVETDNILNRVKIEDGKEENN